MDKRIIFVIASILLLLFGFLIYRIIFGGQKNVKVLYTLSGINNLKTVTDSIIGFNDNTPEAKTWSWDFGDGEMGTGRNVRHSYVNPGHYKIILSVTTENGKGIDSTKSITVAQSLEKLNAQIPVQYSISSQTSKVGTILKFTNQTGDVTEALWDFGDGTTGSGLNTEHSYNASGSYKVRLKVRGSFGVAKDTGKIVIISELKPLQSSPNAHVPSVPGKALNHSKKNVKHIKLEGPGEIRENKPVDIPVHK